jgi:hypothetical protein
MKRYKPVCDLCKRPIPPGKICFPDDLHDWCPSLKAANVAIICPACFSLLKHLDLKTIIQIAAETIRNGGMDD